MKGDLLDGTVWLMSIWMAAMAIVVTAFVGVVTAYLSLRAARLFR